MNCHEFQGWLQERLDARAPLEVATEVSGHLQACRPCRELHLAALRLEQALKHSPAIHPPMGFSERVFARAVDNRRSVVRMTRWAWAAAAAFLVAVSLWGLALVWQPKPEPNMMAETIAPVERVALPSFRASLEKAGQATLTVTKNVARDTADQARVLMPPVEFFRPPTLPVPAETATVPQGVQEAGRSLAMGLEPVTTSAKRAWSMLLREIPPLDAKPKVQ